MKKSIIFENEEILCTREDRFAVISLKEGAFSVLTDLEPKQKLLELMSDIDKASDIEGLVLINSDEYPGDEKYRVFLQQVM